MKLRNIMGSFVIFAIGIGLILYFYNDLVGTYGIVETNLVDGDNIFEAIEGLNIVSGMDGLVSGLGSLTEPNAGGGFGDISGALFVAGLGFLQVVLSLITTPFEVLNVIGLYYAVPPVLIWGVNVIIILYVLFIIVSSQLRNEI